MAMLVYQRVLNQNQCFFFWELIFRGKGYVDKWMCTLKCHCKVASMSSNVYPDKI